MSKTTMFLIAGLAIVGIVLIVTTRNESQGNAVTQVPAAAPLPVAQFPSAPSLPAFSVEASPNYLYFNFPQNRNLLPSNKQQSKDGCKCDGADCDNSPVSQIEFSQPFIESNAKQVAQRFSLGPNPSAMLAQFPPALYPFLYQNGGSA